MNSSRPDARSAEAEAYRRLYKTARWQRIRKAQLEAEPMCTACLVKGRYTEATICHHLDKDAKATEEGFFAGPYASRCKPCHDGAEQQREKRGFTTEIGADGWPTDPDHPSNRV